VSERILAIVPARGGSKGVRRKNLRLLHGRPLLYYILQTALQSRRIHDIVLTSEDDDILSYGAQFGVLLRQRPPALAQDDVPLAPVVRDALDWATQQRGPYSVVVRLQPTCPLLRPETLDRAIASFLAQDVDTLLAATDATHLMWREQDGHPVPDYAARVNRQQLPRRYRESGAFLIIRPQWVLAGDGIGPRVSIMELPEDEGLDIDTKTDWLVAEALLRRLRIAIVTSANAAVGMGHLYRTLTIADALLGHDIAFIAVDTDPQALALAREHGYAVVEAAPHEILDRLAALQPHVVINDVLDTTADYVRRQRDLGAFVVNFEDLGSGADEAHLVFNALYENSRPRETHRFGHAYFCLPEHFAYVPPAEFRDPPQTLLITFGGVDQNNLTCQTLDVLPAVLERAPLASVLVVVGPGYAHDADLAQALSRLPQPVADKVQVQRSVRNMAQVMRQADAAVTSNGRTVYELAAMGVPTISISQNDRETLHLFARYNRGVRYLGMASPRTPQQVQAALVEILTQPEARRAMREALLAADLRGGLNRVIGEIHDAYWRWKNAQ